MCARCNLYASAATGLCCFICMMVQQAHSAMAHLVVTACVHAHMQDVGAADDSKEDKQEAADRKSKYFPG